jgi:UDP-GlcNAc:undecaprenyl-phosphate GlcNAc-1-phosphate transferase
MLFIATFLTSLIVTAFSIPALIKVAYKKRLFDDPAEVRKVHKRIIPNFGGVSIFTAFLFSCSLFIPYQLLPEANILMAAGIVLFMTGLKDDVVGLNPLIKFVAQFSCAIITTVVADLRIESLEGVFGIYQMNYFVSVAFTVLFMVGIVNAFNLIDGIDGLSGTLGVIFSLVFSFLFFKAEMFGWSYMAIALTGGLVAFLFFNFSPAKIFMGDAGSLMLGFIASILSIKFLGVHTASAIMVGSLKVTFSVALVLAILIVPVFDTCRVFTLRILRNTSPFTADSNHLHHRLLFIGLTHIQATLVLALCTIFFIVLALTLQNLGASELVALIAGTALLINGLFSLYLEWYKRSLFSHNKGSVTFKKRASTPGDKDFTTDELKKISKN